MIKKLLFVAGAGIGYVLGTRAGRERYNAMVAKAREVADRPEVQEVKQVVQTEAQRLYDAGRQRLRDRAVPPPGDPIRSGAEPEDATWAAPSPN
jgi:hypothetical protein